MRTMTQCPAKVVVKMGKFKYSQLSDTVKRKAQRVWIEQALGCDATYNEMEFDEADRDLSKNDDENYFSVTGEIL